MEKSDRFAEIDLSLEETAHQLGVEPIYVLKKG